MGVNTDGDALKDAQAGPAEMLCGNVIPVRFVLGGSVKVVVVVHTSVLLLCEQAVAEIPEVDADCALACVANSKSDVAPSTLKTFFIQLNP
ncbi:MAG: hypothetical protein H7203_10670 [Rhizobacter sp.]|nr:hypothetical protein [Burkholderiales bacterium]